MEWWISVDDERLGPLSEDQLRTMVAARQIPVHALVWNPRAQRWQSLGEFGGAAATAPGSGTLPRTLPAGPRTNGTATAALVVGVLAFLSLPLVFTLLFAPLTAVLGIIAAVLAVVARKQITARAPVETGKGLAVAGLVLGLLALILAIAIPLLMLLVFGTAANSACDAELQANLRSAAVAQETTKAATSSYTTEITVLEAEGYYQPVNAGACRETPALDIVSATESDYCMQLASGGTVYSSRATTGQREGPC